MAAIPKTLGEGGAHLTSGGSSGEPSLLKILQDIGTDLATLNGATPGASSAITAPALPAFTDPPSAAEMNALRTLVNQIRDHLLSGGGSLGATLLTTVQS